MIAEFNYKFFGRNRGLFLALMFVAFLLLAPAIIIYVFNHEAHSLIDIGEYKKSNALILVCIFFISVAMIIDRLNKSVFKDVIVCVQGLGVKEPNKEIRWFKWTNIKSLNNFSYNDKNADGTSDFDRALSVGGFKILFKNGEKVVIYRTISRYELIKELIVSRSGLRVED